MCWRFSNAPGGYTPPGCAQCSGAGDTVLCDYPLIEIAALFDVALLCRVINVDQAEALRIAECPLVIIHQRPDEIAAQRHARLHGLMCCGKVPLKVALPLVVLH